MRRRPNFLLLTSDQQHWFTLGCLGAEVRTPNLDRLARRGLLCTRAYCPNPTCTPSRASILTGQYPSQHGAWSLGTKLDESKVTLGRLLAAQGYDTTLVGKAHFQPLRAHPRWPSVESVPLMQDLDFWRDFTGPFYGFNHCEMARNHTDEGLVGQHYALWLESRGAPDWRNWFQEPGGHHAPQRGRWNLPGGFHYNQWIAERTGHYLRGYAQSRQPFFLWASFPDPHPPYLVPAPWDQAYDPARVTVPRLHPGEHDRNPPHFRLTQEARPDFSAYDEPHGHTSHGLHSHLQETGELARDIATYYGMIGFMDQAIGRILDELEETGLADDTLVVFTSDHGHVYGHHGLIAKGPFHYEDLLRVPFMASFPGQMPAGRRTPALQSLVDLAPTFLDFAGLEVPLPMTGRSQRAVWEGRAESARNHVIVENHHQPTTLHLRTFIDERYKLTVYCGRSYGELFDLQSDPGEIRNLWDEPGAQALKAELMTRLVQAELEKEPLPMPRVWLA